MYLTYWTGTNILYFDFFKQRILVNYIGVANFLPCEYFNLLKLNLFYCSIIMLSTILFSSQLLLLFQLIINIIIKITSKSNYH